MKNILLFICIFFCGLASLAQVPEDALKYGWFGPNGTARTQAIGGAIGALGADVTATYVNPAGLAFFKTSDFVVSPGFSFIKNNSNFRGDTKTDDKSFFNLGTSGAVFGSSNPNSSWNGQAFSIAVSTVANFNNRISYAAKTILVLTENNMPLKPLPAGLSINDLLNSNSVSIGTRLAAYTYLIDTLTAPGQTAPDVVSLAMWNNLKNNKRIPGKPAKHH